jgi:hypothetical protein
MEPAKVKLHLAVSNARANDNSQKLEQLVLKPRTVKTKQWEPSLVEQ